jgi:hypothetical protein
MNPFEAIYEKNSTSFLSYMSGVSKFKEIDCNLTLFMTSLYTLKENLVMAQNYMKKHAD